ncbi:hypothetical protein [Kitasatospora sp. NPDC058218]
MEEATVDLAAAPAFVGSIVQVPDRLFHDPAQVVIVFSQLVEV